MKITLQQQIDQIELTIKNKHDHVLACYFAINPKYEIIYDIESHVTGKIIEKRVTSYYLFSNKKPYLYGKKATKKFVAGLIKWFDNYNPSFDDIMVGYEYLIGSIKATGAYYLNKVGTFGQNGHCTFNMEDLIPISASLVERYGKREGYTACAYCSKQVPTDNLISYTIYTKSYPKGLTQKYCSGICGGHDQMAHEG
jgi:hypothetical protein